MKDFEALPLHDAILKTINVDWENRSLVITLHAFTVKGSDALPHVLKFENASSIEVPHDSPWGASVFINRVLLMGNSCEIEMQSGDVIKITAENYSFEPTAS